MRALPLNRLSTALAWLIFVAWLIAQVPFFLHLQERRLSPIDFLTYERASGALGEGQSPYLVPAQSLKIWRDFHQNDQDLRAAHARGEGQAVLRELAARPQQPGPYQYPPTFALLIHELHVSPIGFVALTLLSIFAFANLWLKSTHARSAWLLLIPLSWDVLASLRGGNVEILLLFATLLAARLLWDGRIWIAAPLIALTLLIKPFFALFFVALLTLQWLGQPTVARPSPRALLLGLVIILALVAVEVYRWGAPLRTAALDFFRHPWDSLWFALPVAEQTPMSAWNRTPVQGLVNAGLSLTAAQVVAGAVWLLLLGITVWRARESPIAFPLAFALAFTLLYWGRPVGWGFIYLEFVTAVVIWPTLQGWQKPLFVGVVLATMATRWVALLLTLQGAGFPLLTLQTARWPWETWLVLPAAWLLLVRALECGARTRKGCP